VRLLAEVEDELPPILVHRQTFKVIDGLHRLGAAKLRGAEVVRVRFFDGTDDEAFLAGVRANITHGLPLSRADREAAAVRIATLHPSWSDRAVAAASGLSAKTVKRLRARKTGDSPQLSKRRGRDGRLRPVDASVGRRRVTEAIIARPDASLREIARTAGVSPATAKAVRDRLSAAAGATPADPDASQPACIPVPESGDRPPAAAATIGVPGGRAPPDERRQAIEELRGHPALLSASGQEIVQALDRWTSSLLNADGAASAIPPHCAYIVAAIARNCAHEYLELANQLDDPND
jgi:ParB-like chromosome segregation protein Spo0J